MRLQCNLYTHGSENISKEGGRLQELEDQDICFKSVFYIWKESYVHETLIIKLPKQDLNNDRTTWHANVYVGNLSGPHPYMKNYRQLMTA